MLYCILVLRHVTVLTNHHPATNVLPPLQLLILNDHLLRMNEQLGKCSLQQSQRTLSS